MLCKQNYRLVRAIQGFLLIFLIFPSGFTLSRTNLHVPRTEEMVTSASLASTEINANELERVIDDLMSERMEKYDIPGEAVAVVHDGKLLLSKGYGYANSEQGTPVDPSTTLFRIGSVSKLFVWTAVMQLVEQGKLDLHTDVNTYLKDFQIPSTFPEPITLSHLITHTSGFEKQDWYGLAASVEKLPGLCQHLKDRMPSRIYPPGENWIYSNYGTDLAAYIVEQASSLSYEEYLERYIFETLGMRRSTIRQPLPPELAGDMAVGYYWHTGKNFGKPGDFEGLYPSGAVSTTAEDMAKFMIAHLQNGDFEMKQIFGENYAMAMHRTQFTYDPRISGFTYGFFEENLNGQRIIGHSGGSALFSAHVALIPEHNLGVFEAYGGGKSGSGFIYDELVSHFFPGMAKTPVQSPSATSDQAQKYSGSYRNLGVNRTSPEKLLALINEIKVSDTGKGTFNILGDEWVETEPLVFQKVDGEDRIIFRTDTGTPQGRVTFLLHGNEAYEKLAGHQTGFFHMVLAGICSLLFLSASLVWPFSIWYQNKRKKTQSKFPDIACWIGWGMSTLFAIFPILFILEAYNHDVLLYGLTPFARAVLLLPWFGVVLTAASLIFTGLAWLGYGNSERRPYWRLGLRIHFTLVSLAGIGFIWFLNYWNLL